MAAIPLSSAIGSPISGMILGMHGVAGLEGWQWLFIIEALPAIVLAFITYFYLTDRPTDAHWLAPEERTWLAGRLDAERRQREAAHQISVVQSLYNPRVWALALVYFGLVACNYGVAFWLPQIIKAFGLSNFATGWVTAIPYAIGAAFMIWYGYNSDRTGERRGHTADRAFDRCGRHCRVHADQGSDLDDCCIYDRRLRRVRHLAGVLDPADGGALRQRGRRRHRGDQLDRQSRRLRRPLRHGLDEGRDRKLHGAACC